MLSSKEKYEKYKPKKFLGQNFLVDQNIAKKIVASLEIKPDDVVLEIGPGQGVLTKILSTQTGNLVAIELDRSIFEKLNEDYGSKIKVIHSDFLKVDLNAVLNGIDPQKKKVKVIGNIPYNITTEILFKLYDSEIFETAVLMMQKEVAQRLTAKPDTKDYGILAIQTQIHSKPEILFDVPPTAFFPKPRVKSSVVRFNFSPDKYQILSKEFFKKLVRESFGQRRKTMKNSLKKFFELNEIKFEDIDFDFTRRAENVSIQEFADLSNTIRAMGNRQ